MKPLVTVGIPFYNAEKYLEYAIQSVMNQTYENWQLILIDDGSSDSSLQIARHYESDPRVMLISDGCNMGLIRRLNQMSSMCTTKYYARMDADDIMYLRRLEIQIDVMEQHPDYDVVGSSAMIIDSSNRIVRSASMQGVQHSFLHPSILGKTEWFKNNPYDENYFRAEDFELWQRTCESSVFYNIEQPLLFYREFGVPDLKKYVATQRTCRKIYKKYKNGRWRCNYFLSYVKQCLYMVAVPLNKSDILVRLRRRRPLDVSLCLSEQELINSIERIEAH